MKFPVEKCECGQDLTEATPVRTKLGVGPDGESIGGCPNCWRTYYLVEEKPKSRASRGRTPEPEPEPEPPAPTGETQPGEGEESGTGESGEEAGGSGEPDENA